MSVGLMFALFVAGLLLAAWLFLRPSTRAPVRPHDLDARGRRRDPWFDRSRRP